jgi:hypothetical protein
MVFEPLAARLKTISFGEAIRANESRGRVKPLEWATPNIAHSKTMTSRPVYPVCDIDMISR